MELSKDLVAASATPIVLAILAQGENYGYAIIDQVRRLSEEQIQWADGMLYPVLHRLEKHGLIRSRMAHSNGRKRKYYRLTTSGSHALKRHREQWSIVHSTLSKLWRTAYVLCGSQNCRMA
ncbi:MAG: PadR family transcriptional regulator [Sedimentisphaerales bacterium]|nr:PadR family transcriptional regulator [Sedimentisphaerales bacterium]